MKLKMEAVLFDMDGLLLDTEPLWGISMLNIAKKYAVPVTLEQFRATTGLRIYEVTRYWEEHFPWKAKIRSQDLADEILDDIISRAQQHGRVLPGVEKLLSRLPQMGIKTAVATSSPRRMAHALLEHFGLKSAFNAIVSADELPHGKPHPEVYLRAAELLHVEPTRCLALEDSINGMIAALAARMRVITVPDEQHRPLAGFSLAYKVLHSLEDWQDDFLL